MSFTHEQPWIISASVSSVEHPKWDLPLAFKSSLMEGRSTFAQHITKKNPRCETEMKWNTTVKSWNGGKNEETFTISNTEYALDTLKKKALLVLHCLSLNLNFNIRKMQCLCKQKSNCNQRTLDSLFATLKKWKYMPKRYNIRYKSK